MAADIHMNNRTAGTRPLTARAVLAGLLAIVLIMSFAAVSRAADAEKAGKVVDVSGDVRVRRVDQSNTEKLTKGSYLFVGDTIVTSRNGKVKILMKDESVLTLGRSATMVIRASEVDSSKDERKTVLYLVTGKLRALVNKMFGSAGSSFEVQTPTAVAGVRGTHFVVVSNLNNESVVYCLSGSVDTKNRDLSILGTVVLQPGDSSEISEDATPTKIMDSINGSALYGLLKDTTLGEMDMTVDSVMIDSAENEDISSFTAQDVIDLLSKSGGTPLGQGLGQKTVVKDKDKERQDLSPFGDIPSGGTGGGGMDLSPNGH